MSETTIPSHAGSRTVDTLAVVALILALGAVGCVFLAPLATLSLVLGLAAIFTSMLSLFRRSLPASRWMCVAAIVIALVPVLQLFAQRAVESAV
jgi:hypothetical protein